jgi:DNA topoisomerase-2
MVPAKEVTTQPEQVVAAGSAPSSSATLIVTEGDSAATFALSLTMPDRAVYGVFPMTGKIMNPLKQTAARVAANVEIMSIAATMGLELGTVYANVDNLRYGKLMIMADQDHDGSHVKGLVLNLFYHLWPSLCAIKGFMSHFVTPIVKVTKGGEGKEFYSDVELSTWEATSPLGGWSYKYYKGTESTLALAME